MAAFGPAEPRDRVGREPEGIGGLGQVPEPHAAVRRRRGQQRALRVESDVMNQGSVPLQLAQESPAGDVPELHDVIEVVGSGSNPVAGEGRPQADLRQRRQFVTFLGIEHFAGDHDASSVGAESDVSARLQLHEPRPCGAVQHGRAERAADRESFAVGAERHGMEGHRKHALGLGCPQVVTGRRVPDLELAGRMPERLAPDMQAAVASDGGHPRAVGTEGQGSDGELAGVATVFENPPPLDRVPHAYRVVQAARGDARGVWAEGDAEDLAGVPLEAAEK